MKSLKQLKEVYGKELKIIFDYWHKEINAGLTEMDIIETMLNMKIEEEAKFCEKYMGEEK